MLCHRQRRSPTRDEHCGRQSVALHEQVTSSDHGAGQAVPDVCIYLARPRGNRFLRRAPFLMIGPLCGFCSLPLQMNSKLLNPSRQ